MNAAHSFSAGMQSSCTKFQRVFRNSRTSWRDDCTGTLEMAGRELAAVRSCSAATLVELLASDTAPLGASHAAMVHALLRGGGGVRGCPASVRSKQKGECARRVWDLNCRSDCQVITHSTAVQLAQHLLQDSAQSMELKGWAVH